MALLVGGGLLVFDFQAFLFMLIGMSPTIVAAVIDTDPPKYAARSVGCLNFAGLTPYLGRVIGRSGDERVIVDLASDMTAWLVVSAAAAAGWLIYFVMPMVVGQVMRLIDSARIASLHARQRMLAKEWGDEIRKGDTPRR